jgi:hypothetical protein
MNRELPRITALAQEKYPYCAKDADQELICALSGSEPTLILLD